MTFLAPALLALGLAATVPLALHLLQRHPGPRVVFPALRYLRRAEREHARRIRLRQILLLALRMLAILVLAGAAARPLVHGFGAGHPPTSIVLILDNSLSSGAVVDDRRVLDQLRDAALSTLDRADTGDRFWLIRAGAPWEPALAGDPAMVAAAVRATEPTAAAADLEEAVVRARSILALEPGVRASEIQVLSDLQETGLAAAHPRGPEGDEAPPVVIFGPAIGPPSNRAVTAVTVAGGAAPLAGEPSTVAVEIEGAADDSVAVRLVLDGGVRAAGHARPGAALVLPLPALPAGVATGHVELDPDALRADDRRYFAARVMPPMTVALATDRPFLDEAMAVLEDAGRLRRVGVADADVVLAPGAASAAAVRGDVGVVVFPPATPLELPATNQRLADAGIAWRYEAPAPGGATLDTVGSPLAASLADVRLRQVYGLSGPADDSVALRLSTGEPWAVLGTAADGGRFVLIGSPLTVEGGTLPVSPAMVPFLDHAIRRWAVGTPDAPPLRTGDPIPVDGDAVTGPAGTDRVARGGVYRPTEPGLYHVLEGPDTVASYAVNTPASESRLARLSPEEAGALFPGDDVTTAAPGAWGRAVFRSRVGGEITPWLLAALLALLAIEMTAAAIGRTRREA